MQIVSITSVLLLKSGAVDVAQLAAIDANIQQVKTQELAINSTIEDQLLGLWHHVRAQDLSIQAQATTIQALQSTVTGQTATITTQATEIATLQAFQRTVDQRCIDPPTTHSLKPTIQAASSSCPADVNGALIRSLPDYFNMMI